MQSVYPVTRAQRTIYLGHQLDATGHLYNTGMYTETVGDDIDLDRMIAAVRSVLDAAETLHVNFDVDADGNIVQIPRATREWDLPVVDFRGEDDPAAASDRWMRETMSEPQDLARDLLFRFAIHRLADDRVRLYQQYHHIVNDGYGIGLATTAMTKAYVDGKGPDRAAEWTLERYVRVDEEYVASEQRELDRRYWLDELADLPEVTRLLGSGRLSSPGELVAWSHIDANGRGRLERYARAHGTWPATVLVALLGAYLARATRRRDVVISLPTTARGTRELRTVPAMVASVLPLRFDVPDDARLADVAEVIDGKLLGLLKHGRYRGEDLGRELAEIDPDWRPPTVGVNIMPAAASRYSVGRESQAHMLSSGPVGELEFILVLEKAGHPIEIGLRGHADDAPLAQRCAADLDDFLAAILDDLDAPLGTFDVAPAPALGDNSEADHEDTAAGPLALLPATARRRDAGLSVDADLREYRVPAPEDLTDDAVLAAVAAVVEHHPALRTTLTAPAPVLWLLSVNDTAAVDVRTLVADAALPVGTATADLPLRPDATAGRVLTAVRLTAADESAGELVFLAPAGLVDETSWSIVTADLHRALRAARRGTQIVLPPVPTSPATHARVFTEQAASPQRLAELPDWMATVAPGAEFVTAVASGRTRPAVTVTLTGDEFEAATTAVAGLVSGDATDVWAAITAAAVAHIRDSADGELLIDIVRDGRTPLASDADLTRTVGALDWTTPVRLGLAADPLDALRAAKERLRVAPDRGIGWPMLRYANVQAAPALAPLPQPQVLVRSSGDRIGNYLLDIHVEQVTGGAAVHFTADEALDPGVVDRLAAAWRAALDDLLGRATAASGKTFLTPSDLAHLTLTQAEIDRVARVAPVRIEDIWPLSPLQRGLYFQSVFDSSKDIYTAQFSLDFGHRLDVARLRRAAAQLLAENPTVRAGFTDDGLADPVQFIGVDLEVPFTEIDLTDLDADAQCDRADKLIEEDRQRPFDLTAPPLWRMLLLHLDGIDRLVVNREFILWDGWSGALFVDELLARYAGDEIVAPEADFTDYLRWLDTRDRAAAEQAWRDEFAGFDKPTLLAGSTRDRAAVVPLRIESYIDETLTAALRERARSTGVTLNALMNAVVGLLLAAESGSTDVVFGSTVAGRPTEIVGLDRVIGMFLNTVPVRVQLSGAETVADLLRRMQDEYADRMEFEYLGLGDILRAVGRSELFDTLFVLQNFKDADEMARQSARHDIVAEDSLDHTHYPLAIVVSPGRTMHVKIDYRPDVVDAARARALHDRFVELLDFVARDVDLPVASVPALTAAEHVVTDARLRAEIPEVEDVTVAEMLIARAATDADRIALVSGDRSCTYGELAGRVESLARTLIAGGAGPETIVCLGLPRTIDTVIALFAILRTGAAYLPLELDQPDERLHTVIDDAQPALFLTTTAVQDRLGLPADRSIRLDEPRSADTTPLTVAELGAFAPGRPGRLDHPAYVIYTSGSTGKPKGVVTPYRGLTNMQRNHQDEIFDPVVSSVNGRRMRVAHTVSFAFDMSWEELLWLVEGHEVHVCDEDLRRDSTALVEYCNTHAIDVVNVTPTYATQLIADGMLDEGPGQHRPPLVLLGGEAVSDSVWTRLRETDGTLGYNLYGPTEYTINTLGGGTDDSATPTVGVPIRATRAYILDPWLRPVVDGVVGELYIAGVGLARGYLNRFGLTSDRFVADPWSAGGRMYRTGDLMRRRPDGNLDYLGRVDDQVKIRGYRVELHEIAAVLEEHPEVGTAAVIAVDDPLVPGTKRLAAYAVPVDSAVTAAGADPADLSSRLVAHLRAQLPDYMVPAGVQIIDSVPMTVNGKLDTRALPEPQTATGLGGRAPRTETERALCAVFADVLGIDEVGADDDFFELGGHSMIAMRIVGRIRSELGVDVTIRDLFEARSVEELARRIPGAAAALPPVTARTRPDRVPLSAAQERLWLLQQMQDDSLAYHYAHVARLDGAVDDDALAAAVADVVERHESLRTVVDSEDGTPFQRLLPTAEAVRFEIRESDSEDAVRALLTERLTASFDLRTDPPLRVVLVRVAPDRHVLAVVLHHIATDEWSDAPLLGDLTRAYLARAAGAAPEWSPLPVQYADYTLWQRELIEAGRVDTQIDYWTDALAQLPDEIVLPTDRPRPARPTGAAGNITATIPADVAARLRAVADARGGTMFMALHAATAALLARLGAGDDIVVGTPVSGRSDTALDELVGFFVNTLVLRTDVSGDPTFTELVDRVREADLAAMAHQEVPFQQLVERLAPPRVEGRNPLFQVMVSYLQRPAQLPDLLGVPTRWEPLSNVRAKFDLNVTFVDAPDTGEVAVAMEYAADLFDDTTADTLLTAMLTLIGQVAAAPDARIGEIAILDAAAADRQLAVGTGARADFALAPLGEMLARSAAEHSGRPALVAADHTLTYAALDAASNRLARELAALGAGPGAIVAVAVPRSIEQVVAIHAVVKSGAAYQPIDTTLPEARIEYLLGDARPRVVLTRTDIALPGDHERLDLDDDEVRGRIDAQSAEPVGNDDRVAPLTLDHPVYVIYTSGSTGLPKGVVVSHRAVANRLAWVRRELPVSPDDRVLMRTPATFDVSVWELFAPFVDGACVVVGSPDAHRDAVESVRALGDHDITITHFVPSMLEEALAVPDVANATSLRRILCSGEALSPRTVDRVAKALPQVKVHNLYGPTEAAVEVTLDADPAARIGAPTRGSVIGRPGTNVCLYVLDRYLHPVPLGTPGELYIGGVQVAQGYLRRPALTAQRFVADPYGDPGDRLYRTGDLARWDAHGDLEYLGRGDDQIKLRGLRIELGELEAALDAVDGVARAVAAIKPRPAGDSVLVGYIVPAAEVAVDPVAVRDALVGRVPDYLLPARVLVIEAVPTTFNGKLDRGALPAPEFDTGSGRQPRTELEATIATLFADALGLDEVGIDVDFFALGGHSLAAIRLVNAIRSELGADLALRTVFDAPTVESLAQRCAAAGQASPRPALVAADPRPAMVPLSYAQQRLWILDQLGARGGVYNVPVTWRVHGRVDVSALEAAVRDVVLRHEALRTVFPSADGQAYQQVLAPDEVRVVVDHRSVAAADVHDALAEAIDHRFDLSAELPVRLSVLDAGDGTVVALVIHHIAVDEWSTKALLTDLATAYALRQVGQAPEWTQPAVQYADFTLWQRDLLGDPADAESLAARQRAYWRDALVGLPEELPLPTDRTRPARTSYRGGAVPFALDAEVVRALRELARAHDVSMFMVVQAAVAVLLAAYGGGEDIPLGTPVSGRGDAQLEDLVGFFLNTLVLRTDLSGDPTVAELLDRIRRTDLEAFDHQDLPFEQVVDAVLGSDRSVSRALHPLFQVMIVYLVEPDPRSAGGLTAGVTPEPHPMETSKFDLSFDLVEYVGTDTLVGVVEYSSDLYDRGTVERLVAGLDRVLRTLAGGEAHRRLSAIDVLPADERARLEQWRATPAPVAEAVTVADLFDDAVARHPHETALVAGDFEWGFADLASLVRRWARLLVDHGVAPETRVALVLPRTADTIAAMLAVLASGGAYVALEPRTPTERLATILGTAEPAVVLTTRELASSLPAVDAPVLALDDETLAARVAGYDDAPLTDADRLAPLRADHPAYVVYTSGSTGTPKAVLALHRGLTALFHSHRADLYAPTQARTGRDRLRVGHAWSFAFDASWQPQLWLFDGHAVHVVDEKVQRDPAEMVRVAHESRWDFVEVTPSHLAQLLDHGLADDGRCPASLGFGGEAVSQPMWDRLCGLDGVSAYNLYGPSESTVDALVARASDAEAPVAGRPVAGTRAYIVDRWMRPAPIGVEGELYLAGRGLARGYLADPGRTADRFVADTIDPEFPGDRMYRTGDRALWTPDGHIRYRGRGDDQVKIRGYRIEPAEIETVLSSRPDVATAVVLARTDLGATARLVAYVVPAAGHTLDAETLRRAVARALPDYMVPSATVVLDALPTLANGKIDRAALPRPELAPRTHRAPSTPAEELLCALASEVTGVEQVGVDDDLLELGCDSISVMRILGGLRAAGYVIDAESIFTTGSIGELAATLHEDEIRGAGNGHPDDGPTKCSTAEENR
ncbi:non-ribosomal peptide synthetase [Rhodococcus pyridinivorans]|uniref:Amino acid adenylation domain-containing protein n=1 Tax=Rhodococcus pyridinivorans TaxID=103816 RepID=A0A7M2XQ57_9NOCA|nr:non-ribosomal peptide synthetase [Rhodococcus pyridinivorans]QOV99885.1 amino acid adenylation domain-containing protein [Rhodococcus pyridinivorans]